jgi:MFS family permease
MAARRPLGRVVWALGLTALLTDVGTDMIFPLLPVFLTTVLGAGAETLGLIEGLADSVAALIKLGSGLLLERWPRAKAWAVSGYALSSVARPLVALATLPWHVLAVRVTDRIGKGVRGTARDALLSGAVPEAEQGRAFGFDRAMDNAGALIGPLLASGLLLVFGGRLRVVFALSVVPGLLAVATLTLGVPSVPAPVVEPAWATVAPRSSTPFAPRFWAYLGIAGLFALSQSSDAFLLLRAGELGIATSALPLIWIVLNLSKAGSAYPLGNVSDRVGRLPTLVVGFAWYAASYLAFALASHAWQMWLLFAFYGVFYGLTEGVGKAILAELVPRERRSSGFGLYNGTTGLLALPAGLLTGVLWKSFGGPVALEVDAALAIVACVALLLLGATRVQRRV